MARYWTPEMVYDSEDGYVLFFSGAQCAPKICFYATADTWSYSAGAWTNITRSITGAPAPSTDDAPVDDTNDGYPLLWGGYNCATGLLATSWEFTGSGWTQRSPATPPPAEAGVGGFGMAFDPPGQEVVLFLCGTAGTWTY
jgi:hypothetical protein